mmetsp:Transcript_21300/g.49316  ORF Transcript_21300/g.49316 Transcript_21300/m.49316 type:complete len:251 (-) Transcript_21300:871-1623(-)|eukprot:CAMPEP_0168747762 /NCGR_PEP_ID=MMETSP0724-20121128/15825_1 /TAXON_ID=265536 /ORGANISM="Amphiprora sp., Strain CCMP467" /LENGTH=250 /DNA_ID=CAMNT_0008795565 /DNA_START=84 /DNA_END=836 /DNA_ORIENTATION=+
MKISNRNSWLALLLLSSTFGASAFSPASSSPRYYSSTTALGLTSEEIVARARKAVGLPEEEGPQFVFDEDLLNDMQSALLKLERRVQEGPGSLSMLEVEELDGEVHRILDEMHQNPDKRLARPEPVSQTNGESVETPAAAVVSATDQQPPPQQQPPLEAKPRQSIDISNDEGPEYTGTGGMGLAKGTANTYAIEGMEEMTPDEYRAALDKSISDRARQRRDQGVVGNASSWNYLNSLGGSTSGPFQSQKD